MREFERCDACRVCLALLQIMLGSKAAILVCKLLHKLNHHRHAHTETLVALYLGAWLKKL
jgi:hypothetical protein